MLGIALEDLTGRMLGRVKLTHADQPINRKIRVQSRRIDRPKSVNRQVSYLSVFFYFSWISFQRQL